MTAFFVASIAISFGVVLLGGIALIALVTEDAGTRVVPRGADGKTRVPATFAETGRRAPVATHSGNSVGPDEAPVSASFVSVRGRAGFLGEDPGTVPHHPSRGGGADTP